MINQVTLIGNLGKDPEPRSANGTAVSTLSVATQRRRKNEHGAWVDETDWHRVVAFGKTAEFANEWLRRGRQVFVQGRLQTREWQDQNGNKRWTTEVIAHTIKALGKRDDPDAPAPRPQRRPTRSGGGGYGGGPNQGAHENDPDVPF